MRHHWLLLGACGWVLLILMFVSKFISFRAVDGKPSFLTPTKTRRIQLCGSTCSPHSSCAFFKFSSRLWRQNRRSELDHAGHKSGESRRCLQPRKTRSEALRSGDFQSMLSLKVLNNIICIDSCVLNEAACLSPQLCRQWQTGSRSQRGGSSCCQVFARTAASKI